MSEETQKKPECKAFLFAERVITDAKTGQHNLIGLFESTLAPALPATLTFSIYLLLLNVKEGDVLDLKLIGPAGNVNIIGQFPLDVVAPMKNAVMTLNFVGVSFGTEGTYKYEGRIGGELVATREFTIDVGQPAIFVQQGEPQ